jgi:hypothetical protein
MNLFYLNCNNSLKFNALILFFCEFEAEIEVWL